MFRMLQNCGLTLLLLLACSVKGFAAPGDTTVIPVFQDQVIVTDGSGNNPYNTWAEFPSTANTYGKVYMYLTYQCPNTMDCAEWDYLDPIKIRRAGGVNATDLDLEFARFITPYGLYWLQGSTWKHGWYYEVTDFSTLLHDSVEIQYNHSGYETNTRGWKINVTFFFVEGTPERNVLNITKLYQGGYGYNNTFETNVADVTGTYGANTSESRIKIIQSGHGMNDQNCSEFCPKQRTLQYNGNTIDQRYMWRMCGFNSLYPQAGTWLYDRGNWCPGASVDYENFDQHGVTGGSNWTVDVDMESAGAANFGNQVISAYMVEYGAPNFTTDVALESILAPSSEYESSRINPICSGPVLVIKNSGSAPLTSLNIVYGCAGGTQSTYQWTGNLAFLETDTVKITQPVNWSNSNVFQVDLQQPNGTTDQNDYNNFGTSPFTPPPTYNATSIYVDFKTNLVPSENHYQFIDLTTGTTVSNKPTFTAPNTSHKDTISMIAGHCYSFEFFDDGPSDPNNDLPNDGLNWWANPNDGSGSIALRRTSNGVAYKTFGADFGTKFYYQFMCMFPLSVTEMQNQQISMIVAPNPSATGNFNVSYTLPEKGAMLEVYNMVGMKVYTEQLNDTTGETTVSLGELPKGMYVIKVVTPNRLVHSERVISR